MKKAFLTLGIGILTFSSQAQQGSWYIGGNAGYHSSQTRMETGSTITATEKFSTWSFSPEIGTFLTNNIQLGVALTIGGTQTERSMPITTINKYNVTGGTVYGRYFFGSGAFRPFLGVNVSVLPGSSSVHDANGTMIGAKNNEMYLGANLNAGFALALNSRVAVVGSFGALGFNRSTSQSSGSSTKIVTESFGFENAGTLGQRFNVGIYYTFFK